MYLFGREKKLLLTVVLPVALAVAVAGAYLFWTSPREDPADFRGIRWGENIRNLTDLKLVAEEGNLKFYERENERMTLVDVPVERIVYGFYQDRFYSVLVYFNSAAGFVKIKDGLARELGAPFQPTDVQRKYFWSGDMVNLLLSFDDASDKGRAAFFFRPIQLEAEIGG